MLDYSKQTLSNQEMHEVEKHCLNCEFCNDALDGFMNTSGNHEQQLTQLSDQIDGKKSSKLFYFYVAASIVLVIGLFGLLFESKDDFSANHKEFAEAETKQQPSPQKDLVTEKQEPIEDNSIGNLDTSVAQLQLEKSGTTLFEDSEILTEEENNNGDVPIPPEAIEEIAVNDNDVEEDIISYNSLEYENESTVIPLDYADSISPDKGFSFTVTNNNGNSSDQINDNKDESPAPVMTVDPMVYTNAQTVQEEEITTKETTARSTTSAGASNAEQAVEKKVGQENKLFKNGRKDKQESATFSDLDDYQLEEADLAEYDSIAYANQVKSEFEIGSDYYNQKSYQEAIAVLDRVVKSDTNNLQAAFYLADSYVQTEDYKKAASMYEFIVDHAKSDQESWKAKWNLTNTYILLNKKNQAIKLLDEISSSPNEFQEKAKELKDKL